MLDLPTILTGAAVLILAQWVNLHLINPRSAVQRARAYYCEVMLRYRSKWSNATLTENQQEEIKSASAKMMSEAWVAYLSEYRRNQYTKISQMTNAIVAESQARTEEWETRIHDLAEEIKKIDGRLKITYDLTLPPPPPTS